MSQHQHDSAHLTTRDYNSVQLALRDAERVQADLLAAIADGDALFLDGDRLDFLARRAHKLIAAAAAAAAEVGI